MVVTTLLNLNLKYSYLERRGYVYDSTPVLQSTRKDCREDYLNSDHTLFIVSFGSNLHFATFIRYTHLKIYISIAFVDTLYG